MNKLKSLDNCECFATLNCDNEAEEYWVDPRTPNRPLPICWECRRQLEIGSERAHKFFTSYERLEHYLLKQALFN